MTIMIDQKLARLAKALEQLPEESQDDVIAALESHVEGLTRSGLSDEQRRILEERLAAPREYVSREEIVALLKSYRLDT